MKSDYTYTRRDEGLPLGVTGTRLILIRRVQFETWRGNCMPIHDGAEQNLGQRVFRAERIGLPLIASECDRLTASGDEVPPLGSNSTELLNLRRLRPSFSPALAFCMEMEREWTVELPKTAAAWNAGRTEEIEESLYDDLEGNVSEFLNESCDSGGWPEDEQITVYEPRFEGSQLRCEITVDFTEEFRRAAKTYRTTNGGTLTSR
jgi:hypothetical protein